MARAAGPWPRVGNSQSPGTCAAKNGAGAERRRKPTTAEAGRLGERIMTTTVHAVVEHIMGCRR